MVTPLGAMRAFERQIQIFSIVIIISRLVAAWQILTHILKKVLENSKSGPKAPKICILLSLLIFDRVNKIERNTVFITGHE